MVAPLRAISDRRRLVVLTGGPGGGKSTLIRELQQDPDWQSRIITLPEAIWAAEATGLSPKERLFQRTMVELQAAMEEAIDRAFSIQAEQIILCHRGTLDPLAYWLARGWSEAEFFAFTGTRLDDHYVRYRAVLHLVTAASGAVEYYRCWPEAHRLETADSAIQLDQELERVWGDHPEFFRLDNKRRDWSAKSAKAKEILLRIFEV